MKTGKCISSEVKATIRVLGQAGFKASGIKSILKRAGQEISIRYVYLLLEKGDE